MGNLHDRDGVLASEFVGMGRHLTCNQNAVYG